MSPVYYSQIFVKKDSPFRTFKDLQGSTLAYNCETSLSGYHCLKNFLKAYADNDISVQLPFFKSVVRTGGHKNSAEAVCLGKADVCSLDCNVVAELINSAEGVAIMSQLRSMYLPSLSLVIKRSQGEGRTGEIYMGENVNSVNNKEVVLSCSVSENGLLGPNPAQPVVASNRLSSQQMQDIKNAFLRLDDGLVPLPATTTSLHDRNAQRTTRRFVEVNAEYYNNVVVMMKELIDHHVICDALKGNENFRFLANIPM